MCQRNEHQKWNSLDQHRTNSVVRVLKTSLLNCVLDMLACLRVLRAGVLAWKHACDLAC